AVGGRERDVHSGGDGLALVDPEYGPLLAETAHAVIRPLGEHRPAERRQRLLVKGAAARVVAHVGADMIEHGDMILRNGTIRTLDPSLPTVAALWIAGDRVAGGVGVHETALPSPDTVDLGGRCVLPGFTDSHVHFPTWALSQRDVRLDGCASLAEALDRVRAHPREGAW